MTITKAQLITRVNTALHRSYATDGTTLDRRIIASLKDLSKDGDFLKEENIRDTTIGRAYYSMPTNFKSELIIVIDDYYPLIYKTFEQYQDIIANGNTDNALPMYYTWQGDYFYINPAPDDTYTIRIFFTAFQEEKVTNDDEDIVDACDYITWKDIFREAIEYRLLYYVAGDLALEDDVKKYLALYTDEVEKLKGTIMKQPVIAKYDDSYGV